MIDYDSENYNVTEYKLQTAGEINNSDFIIKTATIIIRLTILRLIFCIFSPDILQK